MLLFCRQTISRHLRCRFILGNPRYLSALSSTTKTDLLVESKDTERQSFKVSYLMKSCGLSFEKAVKASKYINFKTPERPDSVLALLRKWEFSDAQISNLVKNFPRVLVANPETIILPKLEFFRSIGLLGADIRRIVSTRADLLSRSLENCLIPCYDLLKNVTGDEESALCAFKRTSRISKNQVLENVTRNILVLRNLGMSQPSILYLLRRHILLVCPDSGKFCKLVDQTIEMGLDPSKCVFVEGMKVAHEMGFSGLEHKIEFYKKFGWSKEDTLRAFRCQPGFISLSEKRITTTMELFKKMGLPTELLSKYPMILCLSLKNRVIPRCLVAQVLVSKGLLKTRGIRKLLISTEKNFLERYITKFEKSVPQLIDIYRRKRNPCDLALI